MPISEVALERVVAVLREGPQLRLAMLFGSATKGRLRPDSDIDVAIVPVDPELPLRDELELQTRLVEVCGRDVDLVRLDRAPTLVRWQVARDGQTLIESGAFEAAHFVAAATAEYLDFASALDRAAERFRQRLAARTT